MVKKTLLSSLLFFSCSSYSQSTEQFLGIANNKNEDVLVSGYDFPFAASTAEPNEQACFILKDDFADAVKIDPSSGVVFFKKHSYAEFSINQNCFNSVETRQRLFGVSTALDINKGLAFFGLIPSEPVSSQLRYKYVHRSTWIMPMKSLYGDFLVVNVNDSGKD